MDLPNASGVRYAASDDGSLLPIVDVTQDAFALELTPDAQRAAVESFLRAPEPFAKLPAFARRALLRFLLRGSRLAQAVQSADGSYLSGMGTYLLKVGAAQLPPGYDTPLDRKIAAALPSLAVRLRLADMAELAAEALRVALRASAGERPLQVLNIAGGPALDSLNALLVLQKTDPALLAARPIRVTVLDRDEAGPRFGQRALEALQASGAPLAGLSIALRQRTYDWAAPSALAEEVAAARSSGALLLAQSEGGLFEYGSDAAILDNLRALASAGAELRVVGSVTRADEPMQRLKRTSRAATRPRGLVVFRALLERAGYVIERVIERPFSDHVLLRLREP
jgi:hypothetical protein